MSLYQSLGKFFTFENVDLCLLLLFMLVTLIILRDTLMDFDCTSSHDLFCHSSILPVFRLKGVNIVDWTESESSAMTTVEATRIQKYVEDREKQNDIEKNLHVNTWKDVLAKVFTSKHP